MQENNPEKGEGGSKQVTFFVMESETIKSGIQVVGLLTI